MIFCAYFVNAQDMTVVGRVFGKATGDAIPGASIRIPNTNKGTYSSGKGFFRIRCDKNIRELKVSSLGYESKTVEIGQSDTLFIYLNESSVQKKNITVTGNIEPNEVIRRAIEKKNDNLGKLKTFKGTLYSKLNIGLDGNLIASGGSNSISIGASTGGSSDQYKLFLLETFSETYVDYQNKKSSSKILQRRQTANIAPNDNIMAVGNFISFYDNEVNIIRTRIQSPLSDDALDYYDYEILEKEQLDGKYVYVIKVIPNSRIFPSFDGVIKVLEGDYNLVEAKLKPSESTAITFIEDMIINQRYSESTEKIWYPSYLEISGKAAVDVVKGILDLKVDVTATSIYSDVQINVALDDSLFDDGRRRKVTVASDADSTKIEFWENNALREITAEEEAIYRKVDSLFTEDTSIVDREPKSIDWSWMPYYDYNRVSALTPGLTLGLDIYGIELEGTGAWSFGLKNILWDVQLTKEFKFSRNVRLIIGASLFSNVESLSLDRSYSRLVNSVFASLLHFDYYDYYKSEGLKIFAEGDHGLFEYSGGIEFTESTSLKKTTNRSFFSKKEWRENPEIENGSHVMGYLRGSIGSVNYFVPTDKFENMIEFSTIFGYESNKDEYFYSALGKYKTSIPIFETGYTPVKLNLTFEGGLSSDNVPVQYLHRMQSSMLFISKPGNIISTEPAIFGGREYYLGHISLNFTDIWWRFLGLPLFEGRGLNLNLVGSYGKFFAKGESVYLETGKHHYSEVGFGLTRIPTFISNVVYLSFDARWGIGPIAGGNFGWAVSISMPF
jgi:hypothetical protein